MTIKISDRKNVRILPTHIFQTLASSNENSKLSRWHSIGNNLLVCLALILSHENLLTIEQIESFIFPHTHLYIVTLPTQISRSTILGNITLAYTLNRKIFSFNLLIDCVFFIGRATISISSNCQTIE